MGYNYQTGNSNWRETATPGMVYRLLTDKPEQRSFKGDLFICLFISGDCHYNWLRITPRTNNGYHVYYTTHEMVIGYGKDYEVAFPNMRPFTDHDLVHILVSNQALITADHTYTDEELAEYKKLEAEANASHEAKMQLMEKFGVSKF